MALCSEPHSARSSRPQRMGRPIVGDCPQTAGGSSNRDAAHIRRRLCDAAQFHIHSVRHHHDIAAAEPSRSLVERREADQRGSRSPNFIPVKRTSAVRRRARFVSWVSLFLVSNRLSSESGPVSSPRAMSARCPPHSATLPSCPVRALRMQSVVTYMFSVHSNLLLLQKYSVMSQPQYLTHHHTNHPVIPVSFMFNELYSIQ